MKAKVFGAAKEVQCCAPEHVLCPEMGLGSHGITKGGLVCQDISSRLMEKKGFIWGNTKKPTFGCDALNVSDSEMPSGCRGALVPDGTEGFGVNWLVHLHLLTVCALLNPGRKGDRIPGNLY